MNHIIYFRFPYNICMMAQARKPMFSYKIHGYRREKPSSTLPFSSFFSWNERRSSRMELAPGATIPQMKAPFVGLRLATLATLCTSKVLWGLQCSMYAPVTLW